MRRQSLLDQNKHKYTKYVAPHFRQNATRTKQNQLLVDVLELQKMHTAAGGETGSLLSRDVDYRIVISPPLLSNTLAFKQHSDAVGASQSG